MGELNQHLTSLVRDMCKSRLHFDAGFHFQGLVGITLDDKSMLLLDIRDSFRKADCFGSSQESSSGVKAKAATSSVLKDISQQWPDTQTSPGRVLTDEGKKAGFLGPYLEPDCRSSQVGTPSIVGATEASSQVTSGVIVPDTQTTSTFEPTGNERRPESDAVNQTVVQPAQEASLQSYLAEPGNATQGNPATSYSQTENVGTGPNILSHESGTETGLGAFFAQPGQGGGSDSTEKAGVAEGYAAPGPSEKKICSARVGENSFQGAVGHQVNGVVEEPKSVVKEEGSSALATEGPIGQGNRTNKGEEAVRWFKCDVCGYQSRFKNNLKRHLFTHESVGFPCKICKKHFRDATMLAEHVRVAHDNVAISCAECGKAFKTRRALQYHRQKHSGQFKYDCDQCGKKFSTSAHYTDHMNTHSGARETCSCCGKSFLYRSSYNKHLRGGCKPAKPLTVMPKLTDNTTNEVRESALQTGQEQIMVFNVSPIEITATDSQIAALKDDPAKRRESTTNGTASNYTGHDALPAFRPDEQTETDGVSEKQHPQPAAEHLNGDATANLDDTFIDRLAASLEPTSPQGGPTVGNQCHQASFHLANLDHPPQQQADQSHQVSGDGMGVNPLHTSMQVNDVHQEYFAGTHDLPSFANGQVTDQQLLSMEIQTHGRADTASSVENTKSKLESDTPAGPGTASQSEMTNLQPQGSSAVLSTISTIDSATKSPMMWPDSDLVLYRFPLLEQEYALQAANIKQAAQTSDGSASVSSDQGRPPQPGSANPRPPTAKAGDPTLEEVLTEDNYPETYCMYPLPEHCYGSDLWSTYLSGVNLHNPDLLSHHDMDSNAPAARTTATAQKISHREVDASSTCYNKHGMNVDASDMTTDQTSTGDETSFAILNVAAPQPLDMVSDDRSQKDQATPTERYDQASAGFPSAMDSTSNNGMADSPEGVSTLPTENIASVNGPVTGSQLDGSEQYIGAIYPQFPEHMPPNIFDDGSS